MSLVISFKSLAISAFMFLPEEVENLPERTREAYALQRSGNLAQAVEIFRGQADAGDPAASFALGALLREHGASSGILGTPGEYFMAAAKREYPPAQYNLAELLFADPQRAAEGVGWMRKAAGNGSGRALLFVGVNTLEGGNGFAQDVDAAFASLSKAKAAGSAAADFYLGRMYESGLAVDVDLDKARELITAAADKGVSDALQYLAVSYLTGKLGETSVEKGLELFHKGVGGEDGRVFQLALGGLYEAGKSVALDYPKALFWYEQAAQDGEAAAYNKLGFFHERGLGVPVDEAKALSYYKQGGEAGVVVSMYNVAQMLDTGKGVSAPDPAGAAKWLHRAAVTGMPLAQLELGKRYLSGDGLMVDGVAAAAWLERAAAGGVPAAQLRLAQLLEGGGGVSRNMPTAARWYQSAAMAGQPEAMFRLGQLYQGGIGTTPNPVKALGYFLGAADAGYAPAAEQRDKVAAGLDEDRQAEAKAFKEAGFKAPE